MKKIITFFLAAAAVTVQAQTKVLDHAVVTTKTTVISPESDDAPPPAAAGPDGAEIRVMRFGGDGETKSVTTLKGDMVKTFTETDMSRTTVLRDNAKKMTTTLMEMMGKKTGFYSTDEEQEQMGKRMDSMMRSRNQGTESAFNNRSNATVSTTITYVEETKKIAGISCKKALLVFTKQNGSKDTTVAWYAPDFKLQGIVSTGGTSGFGSFGARISTTGGLSDLAGFPMQYELKMNRGRKMIVEVTKINIEKEVADKEFEIPKDFEVKAMKDMQNGNGGPGFQIRMDRGGN